VEGAGLASVTAYAHASSKLSTAHPIDNGTIDTGTQVPVSIPAASIHFLLVGWFDILTAGGRLLQVCFFWN
jgi:hypothetical protein